MCVSLHVEETRAHVTRKRYRRPGATIESQHNKITRNTRSGRDEVEYSGAVGPRVKLRERKRKRGRKRARARRCERRERERVSGSNGGSSISSSSPLSAGRGESSSR